MIKKKTKQRIERLKTYLPYIFSSIIIVALVFVGSLNKRNSESGRLNISALTKNDFSVSTDQLTEFYVVANLSDNLSLASAEEVSSNYVAMAVLHESGQTSVENGLDKPVIVDTSNLSRGIIIYTVEEGDTMETLAQKYKCSTNQIRWSNGLKTTALTVGQQLYLPSSNGIIYTVKNDDTITSIATKCGSDADSIITFNDLENTNIAAGQKIFVPNGTLPETERPEYVPPIVYSLSYLGSGKTRSNLREVSSYFRVYSPGNPGVLGQCTWYAWYWRATAAESLGQLPGGLGNANTWATTLRNWGYRVDNTPEVGAVFQTGRGYYGHVGVVIAVNQDGSITVREMNYVRAYYVSEAEIPANLVSSYYYIH